MKYFLVGILFILPLYVYSNKYPKVPSGYYKGLYINTEIIASSFLHNMSDNRQNNVSEVFDVSIEEKSWWDDSAADWVYSDFLGSPMLRVSERFHVVFSIRYYSGWVETNVECDVRTYSQFHPEGASIKIVNCGNDNVKLRYGVKFLPNQIYFRTGIIDENGRLIMDSRGRTEVYR